MPRDVFEFNRFFNRIAQGLKEPQNSLIGNDFATEFFVDHLPTLFNRDRFIKHVVGTMRREYPVATTGYYTMGNSGRERNFAGLYFEKPLEKDIMIEIIDNSVYAEFDRADIDFRKRTWSVLTTWENKYPELSRSAQRRPNPQQPG